MAVGVPAGSRPCPRSIRMGLRSVILGHAYPPVLDAVRAQLERGSNFTRPSPLEGDLAELLPSSSRAPR